MRVALVLLAACAGDGGGDDTDGELDCESAGDLFGTAATPDEEDGPACDCEFCGPADGGGVSEPDTTLVRCEDGWSYDITADSWPREDAATGHCAGLL